jgi:hypothetical protein
MPHGSEVARLLHQIDLEYEAAKRAMTGFSQTAKHEFITARYNNVGIIQDELAKHLGEEEANQLACERYVKIFDEREEAPRIGYQDDNTQKDKLDTGYMPLGRTF